MKHEVKSLSDYTEAQIWGGAKLKVLQSVASLLILKRTFLPDKGSDGEKNERQSCEKEM